MQKELRAAFDKKKEMLYDDIYLIPVRFEECKITDEKLSKLQRIDLFKKDGYDRLKSALNKGLKKRELQTRVPPSSLTTTFEDIYIVDDTENVERIDSNRVKVSYNLTAEPSQKWNVIFNWIRPGESPIYSPPYKLHINGKQAVIEFISLKIKKEEVKQLLVDRINQTNEQFRLKARNAGSQTDRRKNDEIAAQADQIIREAYIELSRRREEAQKLSEQPNEVICPRHDLSGYLAEKHETRTKIYDYLIKRDYIKFDDSTHELNCFVLTDKGNEYARELFPEFYDEVI